MMFCGKCGTENLDGTVFCRECGAPLNGNGAVQSAAAAPVTPSSQRYKKIGILAIGILAVVVVVILVALLGGRSYQKTVEKCIEAQFAADMDTIVELIPEGVMSYLISEEGYTEEDVDALLEETEEEIRDELDEFDKHFGADWEMSYEILTAEDVKGEDLVDLRKEYDDTDVKIDEAKDVELEVTIQGSESEVTRTMDIRVVKSGRSWYLDVAQMDDFV